MLARLSIRDIVLIDRLDIDFASGLVRAHGRDRRRQVHPARCLCARARRPRRRRSGAAGRRAATGDRSLRAASRAIRCVALMAANDIPAEDELILRRVQFADGRTRAFVNDQPVSAQALKALGAALVEIHGQHDERALVDAATHRRLLDAFGGLEGKAAEVERLVGGAARARKRDGGACVPRSSGRKREADFLRHAVERAAAACSRSLRKKPRSRNGAPP